MSSRVFRSLEPERAKLLFSFVESERPTALRVGQVLREDRTGVPNVLLSMVKNGVVINGTAVVDEDTGEAGDDAETAFEFTLAETSVLPFSVRISTDVGGETVVAEDRGTGKLYIGEDEVGTIDYYTGDAAITYPAAPDNLAAILVSYSYQDAIPLRGVFAVAPATGDQYFPPIGFWEEVKFFAYADQVVESFAEVDEDVFSGAQVP